MGIFALGEGWHNNHHAFQSSARHGLRWWELDLSYTIILILSKIGLVYDVKVPSKDRITAKLKA
jgi:stearoyl-CoA desaturase (delta-9 desaturase)